MRHAFRMTAVTVLALAAVGLTAAEGIAAQPANHACLGADSSAAARALHDGGSSLGAVVSAIATTQPRAIGDEVQAHLAGEIPDQVFPNTCND